MQQRELGSSGVSVGAVGLGCMGMSWAYTDGQRDDAASIAVIHRAIGLGVSLIDTADMYGPFANEELVGKALHRHRDKVILATKGGVIVDDPATHATSHNGRPEHLKAAVEASLRRLQTEYTDLYYLHRVDPDVPLEETWGAMASLVETGKVRFLGISEATIGQLDRAHAIYPITAVQSELSLWTRDPLSDAVPWCVAHGAAFVPFAPLGRGFLTGTIQSASFAASDLRSHNPRFTPDAVAANQAIVDRVRAVADRVGATPAQVAIAWTLAQGNRVIPIPGTRQLHYLEENVAAGSVTLGDEDLAALDQIPSAHGSRY